MDDLLKRMLAVEQEADALVASATEESRRVRAEARRQANEESSREQSATSAAYASVVEEAVSAAETERARLLAAAETEQSARAARLLSSIRGHRGRVVDALLGLGEA